MREDMEYRVVRPPGFQIPCLIFPESAIIEHSELRIVSGIGQGIGLATIVEACPEESTCSPVVLSIESPSALNHILHTIALVVEVHGAHSAFHVGRVEVDASGATACKLLCAHHFPFGMLQAAVLDIVLGDVVIAYDIRSLDEL